MNQVSKLAVAMLGCALVGCMGIHRASGPESLREPHRPGKGLVVESNNGGIDVAVDPAASDVSIEAIKTAGGDSDEEARQRLAQVRVVATRDESGRLCVRAEYPGGQQNGDGCAFTIRMPAVEGLEIVTGNGDVRLSDCGGDARIETSNGSVTVRRQGGGIAADTSNGEIEIDGAAGPVRLHTSNGGVRVAAVAGAVDVHSSNGAIALEPSRDYRESFRLDTSNGSIHVRLTGDAAVQVHAQTSSGRVDARSGRGAIAMSGSSDDRCLVIGGGGRESHARTSNGNIDISLD